MAEDREIGPVSDKRSVQLVRLTCQDCGHVIELRRGRPMPLRRRGDGTWACPHCGGPFDVPITIQDTTDDPGSTSG